MSDAASTSTVDERIANMDEAIALPRSNGELLFSAPWEARAFGLAVALNEAGLYPWSDFSKGLARQIAYEEAHEHGHEEEEAHDHAHDDGHEDGHTMGAAEASLYYERWLATLEALVVARGLVTPAEIEEMMAQQALLDDHDHEHGHTHHDHDEDDDL